MCMDIVTFILISWESRSLDGPLGGPWLLGVAQDSAQAGEMDIARGVVGTCMHIFRTPTFFTRKWHILDIVLHDT